jgi:carboxypeptidase C (cathepsin A)
MLYLEAPVGVGYSYSDDKKDYKTNDDQTALDSTAAMNAFFDAFPKLKSNDFFITGESYAGVYVPTLAEGILHATQAGNYTGAPLKGIAVGNGCSGNEVGSCGGQREQYDTEFLLGQAFVSKSLKTKIRATCDFSKKVTAACDGKWRLQRATECQHPP